MPVSDETLDEVDRALDHAEQLALVASDWNLDEVQIDDAMRNIYEVLEDFRAARARLREERNQK